MNKDDAVNKIARELGHIMGTKSLPKVFSELETHVAHGQHKISKENHTKQLLNQCKTKPKRFIVLQKILALHAINSTLKKELEPAFNKLGFSCKNGALIEAKRKASESLKSKSLKITRKYSSKSRLITESVYKKGEKLAEAYVSIYLIENHLRLFIWKVAGKSNNKLSVLLGKKEKVKINDRKRQEKQNKWLSIRKNSNLFYLDIDDLGKIIQRNRNRFEKYFPTEHWIKTKIDEIGVIRNRIAHNNSFITTTEKKALELYMNQIFEQIK